MRLLVEESLQNGAWFKSVRTLVLQKLRNSYFVFSVSSGFRIRLFDFTPTSFNYQIITTEAKSSELPKQNDFLQNDNGCSTKKIQNNNNDNNNLTF